MTPEKRGICLTAALLSAVLLSGRGFLKLQKEQRDLIRKASDAALAYVSETCGGKARGVDGEEFQVYVEAGDTRFARTAAAASSCCG